MRLWYTYKRISLDGINFSSMGTFNNFGEYHCLALRENSYKTGEGIANNMQRILNDTGVGDQIISKIRSNAPMISDCAKSQKKGNRIFLESISNIGRGHIFTQKRLFYAVFCTIYFLKFCQNYSELSFLQFS